MQTRLIVLALMIVFSACSDDEGAGLDIFSHTYDFRNGYEGWEADFTDYPQPETAYADTVYEFKSEHSPLPSYLGGEYALMLSSNNVSGDLFMFIKTKVSGLRANTNYTLGFEVNYATNAVAGQAIVLKAGGGPIEPKKVIEQSNYTLNIDKGSQLIAGEDVVLLGNVGANPNVFDFSNETKSNAATNTPLIVKTNRDGEAWLIVGTDSAYLGVTTVFYKTISVVFSVSEP